MTTTLNKTLSDSANSLICVKAILIKVLKTLNVGIRMVLKVE